MPNDFVMSVLFEACVDSVASAVAAVAGGAARLELCEGLVEGGLTPSLGKLETVLAAVPGVPVHVLVRPRGGDFCYSPVEVAAMVRDIEVCGAAGAAGVVLGVLLPDGRLDEPCMQALVAVARASGLLVTLHRAVDVSCDAVEAALAGARLGVDFVLSSGAAATALQGAATLAAMGAALRAASSASSSPAPALIAAAGVTPENVAAIVRLSGVRQVHGTAREPGFTPGAMTFAKAPPLYMGGEKVNTPQAEAGLRLATVSSVRAVTDALKGL